MAGFSVFAAPSAAAPAKPDLVAGGVKAPPTIAIGTQVKTTATIRNTGRGRASEAITGLLFSADAQRSPDDVQIGTWRSANLKPGRAATKTVTVRVPAAAAEGPGRLIACADERRQVRESRETNNCAASAMLTVEPEPTSQALIEEAVDSGGLAPEAGLLYEVYAAFGDPRLPAQFKGAPGEQLDAGGALTDVAARWSALSAATQAKLLPFVSPPAYEGSWAESAESRVRVRPARATAAETPDCGPQDTLPPTIDASWTHTDTAHARIWYRTVDAPGASAAQSETVAGWVLAEIETIWTDEVALFGRTPPADDAMTCNGGDGKLDIYVMPVDGFRALTVPFPPGETQRPSFMLVDAGDAASATHTRDFVAHELAHVIQVGAYAYAEDYLKYRWLEEATANYMIDYVYPEDQVVEHPYAEEYLTSARRFERPIEAVLGYGDPNGYEDYVYLLYAAREYGPFVIKDIWDGVESAGSVEAVDAGVPGGWRQIWPEFALQAWNRAGATFFSDQDAIPFGLPEASTKRDLRPGVADLSPVKYDVALDGTSRKVFELAPEIPNTGGARAYRNVSERSINYTQFKFPDDAVRSFRLESFSFQDLLDPGDGFNPADAKLQALLTLADGSTRVEDWTNETEVELCRDTASENVTELLLVYTNSRMSADTSTDLTFPQAVDGKTGRAVAGRDCFPERWDGTATGSIDYGTGTETWEAELHLERESVEDGVAYYKMASLTWHWSVSATGSSNGCTVSGADTWTETNDFNDGLGIYEYPDPEFPDEYSMALHAGHIAEVTQTCPETGTETISWFPLNIPDEAEMREIQAWSSGSRSLSGSQTYVSRQNPGVAVEWSWELTGSG